MNEGLTPDEQQQWDDYVRHFRAETLRQIDASAMVMQVVPRGDFDVQFATELGAAIMLDKPLLAIAMPGAPVPPKLARISDELVHVDLDTEDGQQLIRAAVERIHGRAGDLPAERWQIRIPGEPVAKARPRFDSRRRAGGPAYTEERTEAAENAIRWELRARRVRPLADDVALELHFHIGGRRRVDLDNLEKLVMDACNTIAWNDDSQVVEKRSWLHRDAPDPHTLISIRAA